MSPNPRRSCWLKSGQAPSLRPACGGLSGRLFRCQFTAAILNPRGSRMLLRDFTYAARTLAKSPVFAATAIVTIALGIGASTAIFSVTNAVLLRPLPYKNPDRLAFAISDMRKRNVKDFPLS